MKLTKPPKIILASIGQLAGVSSSVAKQQRKLEKYFEFMFYYCDQKIFSFINLTFNCW